MTLDLPLLADAFRTSMGIILSRWDRREDRLIPVGEAGPEVDRLYRAGGVCRPDEAEKASGGPVIFSDTLSCFWGAVETGGEVYVLGPTLIHAVSREQVVKHYLQRGFSAADAMDLAARYEEIPVISGALLAPAYRTVCHVLLGGPADLSAPGLTREVAPAVRLNEEDIYNIQERDFNLVTQAERRLMDCIQNGDVERLEKQEGSTAIPMTELGPDALRSTKNTMIVGIALATRAAIRGGLPVSTAFPVSDMYIMRLEEETDLVAVTEICFRAFIDFATRVRENRYRLNYSRAINACCDYIGANIHRPLRLAEIAETVGLHPDTLSRRFRQETGMTVSDYIRVKKVDEAKALLKYTGKRVVEVANMLGYSSQSQFIAAFKRTTGHTPHAYRSADAG